MCVIGYFVSVGIIILYSSQNIMVIRLNHNEIFRDRKKEGEEKKAYFNMKGTQT